MQILLITRNKNIYRYKFRKKRHSNVMVLDVRETIEYLKKCFH